MIDEVWHGCYRDRWTGLLTEFAMRHPAKMAKGLTERIYRFLEESGRIPRSASILDPFGGIGTTGLIGAWRGHRVTCVELEHRWAVGAAGMACPGFNLNPALGIIRPKAAVCPACQDSDLAFRSAHVFEGAWDKSAVSWAKLGLSAPTMIRGDSRKDNPGVDRCGYHAVISSPPYGTHNGNPGKPKAGWDHARFEVVSGAVGDPTKRYGGTAGNIAAEKFYPYEKDRVRGFWIGAMQIIRQTMKLLIPGGVAAWVVKDYVLHGCRQPFSDWWENCCVDCGMFRLGRAKAMLVRVEEGINLFGERQKRRKGGRKSPLKRLHDRKLDQDDPRWVDHEDVIFLENPQ